jgi:hypothetical protein
MCSKQLLQSFSGTLIHGCHVDIVNPGTASLQSSRQAGIVPRSEWPDPRALADLTK